MAMKHDLWDGTFSCPSCGTSMHKSTSELSGMRVRTWKCPSCGDELVHPEDAQKALAANKLKLGVRLKIGELNKAPYVRFTKEFADVLRKGGEALVTQVSANELRLKILK